MGHRGAKLDAGRARPPRAVARLWRLVTPFWTLSGLASRLFTAAIIYAAAVPFAGWMLPTAWFAGVAALILAHAALSRDAGKRQRSAGVDPFLWLLSAAYALAAFYLVLYFNRAAQTLGVTLFGVIMFQVLARDYAAPRRLAANLAAPVALVIVVQAGAAWLLIREAEPWKIVTLLASPLIVLRAFLAVRQNLNRSLDGQRGAMARLSESEMRYRMLAERSPDVIIRYDVEGRVEYLSPAARAYGWDPDTAIGKDLAASLDRGELERNARFLEDLAAGRPLPQGEENVWRSRTDDGELVFFEGRSSPITDDEGRVLGAMSVLRDVTERRAMEDELRAKRAEAEAAAVAKSQFLANMSHEVRTPLTGVIGFARLLEAMDDLSPDARRYALRIGASGEALLAVVNDILDFSKLEAGQMELDLQPFDPRAFVEETADLVRDQAEAKHLVVTTEFVDELPAFVRGDAARLRQVLLNLLTNAVKFTDVGRVRVRAGWRCGRLAIAVRDTGPGVPADLAGRLFQRFSQIDGSNARRHGGAGLGLAICKGLVEKMGGEIGLKVAGETAPVEGATFWFRVPAPQTDKPAERPAPAASTPNPVGRTRMLVVDDVAVNRELVATLLSQFDIEIVQAASGAEAVQAALVGAFDLILMDLQMPGMDGLAAAKSIRANAEANRTTPIIALSANVLPTHVEACLKAGMNDHVGKPIDAKELLVKLAKWTGAASGTVREPLRA
jgi:PAS domain S-box-containing protein